ncbi:MAG: preprotein translocase subunit SecA [Veillonellaceae bacterium]|uniref:preprotein translocase subunit SecA n=1 Tax=Anaerovibrio lipolyticus TaxID=82374 RepID=UPI001F2E1097|nr:preprotein translocase subunit SecA [Anaerovibrio lipolyticus]MCI6910379.1 preprotein translocase subunit SecA [Veillonellaceae bacterium]MDY5053029.1 preprotein translocase subunit SecA [Anaerovibrio sp.]MCF2601840.1 preprotein translocase subunit SecA [Anaerovibrio lipolyticus]MCI7078101.1 preprotein translocase subunit SecA [Veillonellaceae bacterium]MCI7091021.1 preprotein translocase subunit SecA [Veillonellaceae bacterium]
MFGILKRFLGDNNDKEVKRLRAKVDEINGFEEGLKNLSDSSLARCTDKFRDRLAEGETLDDILPEAFAVVREASRRILGMRHFDVQMMGGICLHEGKIAEMRTGEGKTLVATLPTYLNALTGKGVHIVTVNDYLAKRDSIEMGRLYNFLGLSVGLVRHDMDFPERKYAYSCDITFGTNNEFGFDYLRDNMVVDMKQMVQRELNYAIVDEVDSILVDEARTPLIISGPGTKPTETYVRMAKAVNVLQEGVDYTVDEKAKTVAPADTAIPKIEKALGIKNMYDPENMEMSHCFMAALRAKALMKRDRDYVVKDGEIIIVDEFTGRLMQGRRYSDGLHQAIEAKEGLEVQRESQTLASITFQNYFRMYNKLSGMTGTAKTEEDEFLKIYKLPVIVIPTNRPIARIDHPDVIYKTKRAKYKAVANDVEAIHQKGQPVLIGTTSITQSEELSRILSQRNIPHNVLNAKFHEQEAEIIADAGQKSAVTIATNMAGRGTDIKLGEGVPELGGLFIVGTERHESRRIDNQLRGRAGRQGDPGESRFYLSLEDDLLRLFGSDNIAHIMDRLGMGEDDPIEHKLITRSIENAQKKVEGRNFDMRKHVLEYDDVMNQQREVIYGERRKVLLGDNLREHILGMLGGIIEAQMNQYANEKLYPEEWSLENLITDAEGIYAPKGRMKLEELEDMSRDELQDFLTQVAEESYTQREQLFGEDNMRELEKIIMLRVVDNRWMEHLDRMDMLREGIGLLAYGQRQPLVEYKIRGHEMFNQMIASIQNDIASLIFRVNIITREQQEAMERENQQRMAAAKANHGDDFQENVKQPVKNGEKIGRNDPCPCGSGKKYKNCCGKNK